MVAGIALAVTSLGCGYYSLAFIVDATHRFLGGRRCSAHAVMSIVSLGLSLAFAAAFGAEVVS